MISVGIVSVQKKRRSLIDFGMKNITLKEKFGDEVLFIPIEVCSAFSSSSAIGKAVLKKRIRIAERMLKDLGVNIITRTNDCNDIDEIENDTSCSENGIPLDELLNCFIFCMKKCGIKSVKNKLIINDRQLIFADIYSISSVCLYAKNILLKTDFTEEAEKIAEKIFFEFGVWIEIEQYEKDFKASPSTMLIDADRGIIRVADMIIDGVDYGIDCRNYNINIQDVLNKIKKINKIQIKNMKSGNNIVKML